MDYVNNAETKKYTVLNEEYDEQGGGKAHLPKFFAIFNVENRLWRGAQIVVGICFLFIMLIVGAMAVHTTPIKKKK